MLGVKTAALPASLRRTNQRTVISLLLRLGSASRADLAKAAGISQPTAGKITTELLRFGLLQEAGLAGPDGKDGVDTPRLGRPGQLLRLDSAHQRFLAIELGVSDTSLAALPVAVSLQDEWEREFPTPKSPEAWIDALKKASKDIKSSGLWGVLISVPGIVDEAAGKVLFSPNLHWLEKVDLPALVQEVWDLPVLLVQEIRALALGQLTADPVKDDFLLVDFGQGVGGAIVSDGELYSHPKPISGEVGHTPVPGNQRLCGCGAVGCLETLVSQRGLMQSYAEAVAGNSNTWRSLVRHVAAQGVEPWLGETLDQAGKVIAGALNVLGLHRVIVTGTLAELHPGVLEHLAGEVSKGAMWARFGEVTCESAPHRRAAGLVAVGLDRLVLPTDEESEVLVS